VDDFELLNNHVAVGRGFDNRVGTWTAIEALRIAAASRTRLKCAIYACSSIQEEVGCFGAAMNAFNLKPDAAVAVDVTHATDSPGIEAKQHGQIKLAGGPTVSIGRENHPVLVAELRKTAKKKKIAIQVEAFSLTGGTDALSIFTKKGGIPSAVLGILNRYMHTTVELIDLRDLENAAKLLAAFTTGLKKGRRFKVRV